MGSVVTAGASSAHANLVSTSPANGAHAESAPAELALQLDEPVTLVDNSAQLIDSAGDRFELARVRLDDGQRRIVLVPAATIPDGAYLATARAVSADTHVVSLSLQFTVGAVTEHGEFSTETAAPGVERYLNYPSKTAVYLGAVLSAGLFLVSLWVWPAARSERRFRVVYRIGAGILIAGLAGRLTVLAAQRSGGLSQITGSGIADLLLAPQGLASLAAVASSVLAVSVPASRVLGVLQAGTAIVAVTLGGHGGSPQGWPLPFLGTLLHVYGITVWLGGVATIVLVLRGAPRLRRWHSIALAHVLVVMTGGLVLAVLQVRPVAALVATPYGLVLLGKTAVAVAIAAFGYSTYRWFRREETDAGRPRSVLVEAGLAVTVLAVTSVLTTLPPAEDIYTTNLATTLDFGASEIVRIDIDTIRRGPQQLTVDYRPPDSAAAERIPPSLAVDLSSASANVARLPVALSEAVEADGALVWRSEQLIIPAPGVWKVTVRFDGGHGPRLASFHYEAL
ncbi:copper resistance CopC/CopD family protein [Nocardia higoensis]|uniref:copper resistance CopC/CopD family protein n=1 Tax=Nocardia higoensis TaxID=228599 RepID=UPI001FE019CA|nr:copper resistance protein CopC [Nocardia higoensis]